jgi:hypothetical protein
MQYEFKKSYRNGPDGFVEWCEENVMIPIYSNEEIVSSWRSMGDLPDDPHPVTGKSYKAFWEEQKFIIQKALEMKNGRFVNRLIVLCWQRGEGKSLLACLIQLWKFFCWPRQQIMLGANSKDQVKFVHFDIMRDIIFNSPRLLSAVGPTNVREKEIRLRSKGNIVNLIRSISSFTGIVSNITGYTFSEMFDMKNPRFFVQLDGSVRNIPNALGVIDSTVSDKTHVLYQLYDGFKQGKSRTVFFSYRYSREGVPDDYWNPHMDEDQLEDYRIKFPLGEFERYFLNLWTAGVEKPFTDEMVEATNYLGLDGNIIDQKALLNALEKKNKLEESNALLASRSVRPEDIEEIALEITQIKSRLTGVNTVYRLDSGANVPLMASMNDLNKLSELYDTDWSVLIGYDRADPMKTRSGARTVLTCVAKGLRASKSSPLAFMEEGAVLMYIYFLLHLASIETHSLDDTKRTIEACQAEFDGIDTICGERWGSWDLVPWCEDLDINLELVHPTYDRQRAAFSQLYTIYNQGRFKTPPLAVSGSKMDDLLKEEAGIFNHDLDKRWFGSLEKEEKRGIQDDAMFSLGWCIYGGRELTLADFRERNRTTSFGMLYPNRDLVANY